MGLDKSATYMHHYSVVQSMFTAHKNFCTVCFHLGGFLNIKNKTDKICSAQGIQVQEKLAHVIKYELHKKC